MADRLSANPDARTDALTTSDPGQQQCGRCRHFFEMESASEPGTLPEMWLCAGCRVALLGRPTRTVKPTA